MEISPSRSLTMLRNLLVICASIGGAGLAVTACSSASPAQSSAGAASGQSAGKSANEAAPVFAPADGRGTTSGATDLAKLAPGQSIIYTANLSLRVKNVSAVAAQAADDVTASGGYVADEQQTRQSRRRGGISRISLQVKIPVAEYRTVLAKLSGLGRQLSFSEQATDVTQEVADVSSRVTSAEAAIRQLRELLSRAGNVGQLLSVQDQINSEEISLEALLAQQRALAHETTFATVSVALLGHRAVVAKKPSVASHGLVAGLATGWRALKDVVVWLLTALGTVLPFAVPLAFILGIALIGRRKLAKRRAVRAAA